MLDGTFYLDGVDARTAGIRLQKPISIDGIEPIITRQHIPGRNGDIIFNTGAFKNRKGEARCFALDRNVINSIDAASAFLQEGTGYRKLECSDDPEHYWSAMVLNGADVEQKMRLLAPFKIKFDCKPQRWVRGGDAVVSFTSSGDSIYNSHSGIALPIITVHGTNDEYGSIKLGDRTITIGSITDGMIIDCELQTAFSATGYVNLNKDIFAPVFPRLMPGENVLHFSGGISKIDISPRWWDK